MSSTLLFNAEDVPAACWRLHALADLHWRRWGDDWAVFDVGSGQTHRFDTVGAVAVLSLEGTSGVHFDDISEFVSQQLGLTPSPALSSTLAGLLHHLSAVGLIEPVPR